MQFSWTTVKLFCKKLFTAKKPYSLHRVYKYDTSDPRINLVVGGLALSAFFPLFIKTSSAPLLLIASGFIALLWGIRTKTINHSFIKRLLATLITFIFIYILISSSSTSSSKTTTLGNMLPYIISLMFTRLVLNKTYLDINILLLVGLLSLFLSFTLLPSIYIGAWFAVYLVIMIFLSGHLLSRQSKVKNILLPSLWKIYLKILIFALGFSCAFLIVTHFSSLSSQPRGSYGDVSEFSTVVTDKTFQSIEQSKRTAFRFTIAGETSRNSKQAPEYWYWKSQIYYTYNGNAWTRPTFVNLLDNQKDKTEITEEDQDTQKSVVYTLTKTNSSQPFSVLDQPLINKNLGMHLDGMPYSKNNPAEDPEPETFKSNPEAFSYSFKNVSDANKKEILKASLQLPLSLSSAIPVLSNKLKAGATTEQSYIDNVLDFYKKNFAYTLKPTIPNKNDHYGDPIERFLLDTRKGACLDFSSGMILLLRSQNIPARLIAGYNGSQWNEYGHYWQVNQKQAHAWVEAWFPDKQAWVRIDPTESVANVLDRGVDLTKWDLMKDYFNQLTSQLENIDVFHLSGLSNLNLPTISFLENNQSSKWLTLVAFLVLGILVYRTVFQHKSVVSKTDKLLRLINKKTRKSKLPPKEKNEGWMSYETRVSPLLIEHSQEEFHQIILYLNQWLYGDNQKDPEFYENATHFISNTDLIKRETE